MRWTYAGVAALSFLAGSAFFAGVGYITLLRCMRSPRERRQS